MRISDSAAILAALALLGPVLATCAPSPQTAEMAKVQAVIERSKNTHATYAAYQWLRITPQDAPAREVWAAEFNSGNLHRVETENYGNLVANCATVSGSYLPSATGQLLKGAQYAKVACGINTNSQLVDQRWLGVVQTPFGKADRVRLVDAKFIRTYDVNDEGVLVRVVFRENAAGHHLTLVQATVALTSDLPGGPLSGLFDEGTLRESFVPGKYKAPPTLPRGALEDFDAGA